MWKEIACLFGFIVGVVLFLYGTNYYAATVGWIGFFVSIGSIIVYVILKVDEVMTKRS